MRDTPAFPSPPVAGATDERQEQRDGMTLHDYAAIKFAAAWTLVLGSGVMNETREQRAAEAVRLGRLQADAFSASGVKGPDDAQR